MFVFLVMGIVVIPPLVCAQEAEPSGQEAMYYRYLEFASYVKGGNVDPHWMADGSSFWYAEGAPDNTTIWKVDPYANSKAPLFDTERLREALTPLLDSTLPEAGLPFEEFSFVDNKEEEAQFAVGDQEFVLRLDTYDISRALRLSSEQLHMIPRTGEVVSPDGLWFAGREGRYSLGQNMNLYVRSTSDGERRQLTAEGTVGHGWASWPQSMGLRWSSASRKLAAKKIDFRSASELPLVRYLEPNEEVRWRRIRILGAGGALPQTQLFIIDIASGRRLLVDTGDQADALIYILGWLPDGSELFFLGIDREFRRVDLMAAYGGTGATRVVFTEISETAALNGLYEEWTKAFHLLDDGERFLWLSERDGWRHVYLYDTKGNLVRQLTAGDWPVVQVLNVDDKDGWVYFTGHGDRQRPYDTHLYRVDLNGQELSRLTEATGQHAIQFAPSGEFFLDTHSTVNRLPAVDLRRANGELLQALSTVNPDALAELHWGPPEEFVVKAADGQTDLYGVLYKPYDFDPEKKYPVIEVIYGGAWHSEIVRSTFTPGGYLRSAHELAQLGFITFVVDGRGTPERGKEFRDIVYGSIADHVATLAQLAVKRPYMDLDRVGIFGHSFGGYMALRAMLQFPDIYHVAVASAPYVELAGADFGDAEPYLGLPQENRQTYQDTSNLLLAENLKGRLMLIHGTGDFIVPVSHTLKMVDALIEADKPFDLLVLPGRDHRLWRNAHSYVRELRRRYFQEHLKP